MAVNCSVDRQREYAAKGVAWFSVAAAATYLGFPSARAFRVWLHRRRAAGQRTPRVHWLGDRMRFRRVDLDAVVEPAAETPPRWSLVRRRA